MPAEREGFTSQPRLPEVDLGWAFRRWVMILVKKIKPR